MARATVNIVNPADRDTSRYSRTRRYVLWFGACGATYVMCWARSLDDALETCADWLADNAPGLIMTHDDPELDSLYREACEELGEDPDSGEGPGNAWEQATADLTPTGSGYIPSDEWGIVFDGHASRADVKAWLANLEARHYSDEPLIAVG
jgi:hypothetical protein